MLNQQSKKTTLALKNIFSCDLKPSYFLTLLKFKNWYCVVQNILQACHHLSYFYQLSIYSFNDNIFILNLKAKNMFYANT